MARRLPAALAAAALLLALLGAAAAAPGCACPPASRCTFRVLALGDSLTRGAVPSKHTSHPYTIELERRLKARIGARVFNRASVQVTTAGLDFMGTIQQARDGATNAPLGTTLVPYTQQLLRDAAAAGKPYQFAVVMAGINDLGAGNHSAAAIMPRLVETWNLLLESGATVLAVEPFVNRYVSEASDNERQRQLLIKAMRSYAASEANSRRLPRVYLLSLPAQDFDFYHMPAGRVAQMQDDLLHLTAAGYDTLGGVVFDALASHLHPTQCLCPPRSCGAALRRGAPGTAAASG